MLTEQIKQEIAKQVSDNFKDLKESLEIFGLPLRSQYKILTWLGPFDGTILTPLFNANLVQNRIIVVKSIRFVPYANGNYIDIALTDGITTVTETIPDLARLERVFDVWDQGNTFRFSINGNDVLIHDDNRVTADFFADNIYYKYPEKVQTINVSMQALVVDDVSALTFANPQGKCFVECYLI